MPPEPTDPDQETLDLLDKHLARYQAIVSRLAGNGVQVKTWCVTAVAALAAIAVNSDHPAVLAVALATATSFLLLDAYFLALERHFRDASERLIDDVSEGRVDWRALFKIEPASAAADWSAVVRCAGAAPIRLFYGTVALLLVVGLVATLA